MLLGGCSPRPNRSSSKAGALNLDDREQRGRGHVSVYARHKIPQDRTILTEMAGATFGKQVQEESES
jgi:hypothetical protein